MTEVIDRIEEYHNRNGGNWGSEAGYKIITDQQEIILAIDDDASCCETWGYFLTEDDTSKFIGTELRGVRITDTNRLGRDFTSGWSFNDDEGLTDPIYIEEGDVMFVDIETSNGILQFVAYNAHNGYYGHEARVVSKQLNHSQSL